MKNALFPNLNFISVIYFLTMVLSCCSCDTGTEKRTVPGAANSSLVHKDSANRMIQSYISSLDTSASPDSSQLYSIILDVEDLRNYLSDTSVRNLKIMLAHTQDYINSGHEGIPAGYNSDALTVIVAGYNVAGDYVLLDGQFAVNRGRPCPRNCPDSGTAQSNIIQ